MHEIMTDIWCPNRQKFGGNLDIEVTTRGRVTGAEPPEPSPLGIFWAPSQSHPRWPRLSHPLVALTLAQQQAWLDGATAHHSPPQPTTAHHSPPQSTAGCALVLGAPWA